MNFDPDSTHERHLEDHFAPYGKLKRVQVKRNYGFVQYELLDDAIAARSALSLSRLQGKLISFGQSFCHHAIMSCNCLPAFSVTNGHCQSAAHAISLAGWLQHAKSSLSLEWHMPLPLLLHNVCAESHMQPAYKFPTKCKILHNLGPAASDMCLCRSHHYS